MMNITSHGGRKQSLGRTLFTLLLLCGGAGLGQALPSEVASLLRTSMPVEASEPKLTLVHGLLLFEPDAWFPAHFHGGPGLYTLIEGGVSVRDGDGERHYGAGESYVQDPGEVLAAGNVGEERVTMAVAFVLEQGAHLTTFEEGEAAAGYLPGQAGGELPAPEMVHDLGLQVPAPGERLQVVQLVGELAPGARTALHSYPGPYLATVLSGQIAVNGSDGGGRFGRHEGWSVPTEQDHTLVNDADERARFVATFLLPRGE